MNDDETDERVTTTDVDVDGGYIILLKNKEINVYVVNGHALLACVIFTRPTAKMYSLSALVPSLKTRSWGWNTSRRATRDSSCSTDSGYRRRYSLLIVLRTFRI